MEIKVYTPHLSTRLKYALDLVLHQVGEVSYCIVHDIEQLGTEDLVLNYSGTRIENSFQVHPFGLLFEKDIQNHDVPFDYRQDEFLVNFFPTEFDDLGFDIFSASFFLASRYEEYRKFEPDSHGRFQPKDSIQTKIGILKRPIINIWVKALKSLLESKWNVKLPTTKQFKIVNTIDVDNAWAFKNKGVARTIGGIGKSLVKKGVGEFKERVAVVSADGQDPYDTFDYLKSVQEKYNVESIYFFLVGNYQKPYDTNVPHTNKEFVELVKKVSHSAEVGIHPSYASYLNDKQVKKEIERVNSIIESNLSQSRQHFLKLSIPDSYRVLEKTGVSHDYTMGYAQEVGCRAGVCTPFTFFDLLQDKPLELTIHPFAFMDGTLNEYLKQTPMEAKETISFLMENVQKVKGEFIGIWHNSSVNDLDTWKGWREVFEWGLQKQTI
jgi:hypothetical protein